MAVIDVGSAGQATGRIMTGLELSTAFKFHFNLDFITVTHLSSSSTSDFTAAVMKMIDLCYFFAALGLQFATKPSSHEHLKTEPLLERFDTAAESV